MIQGFILNVYIEDRKKIVNQLTYFFYFMNNKEKCVTEKNVRTRISAQCKSLNSNAEYYN